ncbi:DUF4974 domain-containing protein [Niastella caeni]|uniref:DUF4974 domain-containing protein n=1 Tax=Niastella caeni TaxID=2569763 RepID=A0A4S8HKK6_9BACT|nr:DUF4974 domain-containing protein [Niastella caeni]
MVNHRLLQLLELWAKDQFVEAEKQELIEMLQVASAERDIIPALEEIWEKMEDEGQFSDEQQQMMIRNILDRYPARSLPDENEVVPTMAPVHRVHFIRKWWAVAASIAFIAGIGVYGWFQNKKGNSPAEIVRSTENVQPGKTGTLLTLADGSKVLLDTIQNGNIALQGGVVASIRNGVLLYEGTGSKVLYNTISTPKGKQFQLKLSDGTNIWLNAESSIRYPIAFTGKERLIHVAGEVYLEVAHKASTPFRVDVNGSTWVEVLGTHFNVNAYENEGAVRTTLLQGSVKVGVNQANTQLFKVLSPGQQALMTKGNDPIRVYNDVNVAAVVAWKAGVFDFENVPLEEAMRQLARWYDIEVVYEQPVPRLQLGGTIKRSLPFTDVLYFLGNVGLRYKLEGNRKLVILPG